MVNNILLIHLDNMNDEDSFAQNIKFNKTQSPDHLTINTLHQVNENGSESSHTSYTNLKRKLTRENYIDRSDLYSNYSKNKSLPLLLPKPKLRNITSSNSKNKSKKKKS